MAGIDPRFVLFRLWFAPIIIGLVLAVAALARQVSGAWWTAPLAVACGALIDAMREAGRPEPTIDAGLLAIAAALGLPRGFGVALFAVGRAAGWVAHVLEQYEAGFLIRPRALYRGPA